MFWRIFYCFDDGFIRPNNVQPLCNFSPFQVLQDHLLIPLSKLYELYSKITDFKRENGRVRLMKYPILVKFMWQYISIKYLPNATN